MSFKTDLPVLVKEVTIHLANVYPFPVENFISLAISLDGVSRHNIGPLVQYTPTRYWLGDITAVVPVGRAAKYIYLSQTTGGVEMGIAAIEIIT